MTMRGFPIPPRPATTTLGADPMSPVPMSPDPMRPDPMRPDPMRPDPMRHRVERRSPRRLALSVLGALAVLGAVTVPAGGALAAADTSPPTRPAPPIANPITPINATIRTGGSTDNDRVAGYVIQRQVNGVWTDWSSSNIEPSIVYLQPLTPGTTYTVVAVAFDPAGNRSSRSDPLTFTTTSQPAPTCRVMRQVLGASYLVTVFIDNLTTAVVANWTATFTLPAAHTTNFIFNATLARTGDAATFTPASNTAQVNPGATVYFGFHATRPAGSPLPSGFAVNRPGAAPMICTVT
jgi:hypothetical protein